jgi:hypothetical protein
MIFSYVTDFASMLLPSEFSATAGSWGSRRA